MGTTLNRHAYQQMIDEDLEWLNKQERTLEREHIIDIVRQSPEREYGKADPQKNLEGDAGQFSPTITEGKTAKPPDAQLAQHEIDFDNMAFYGFRYCLGRQTYAVADAVEILTRNWNRLTVNTRAVIRKDIIEAFDRNRYGSELDREQWAQVLDLDNAVRESSKPDTKTALRRSGV